MNVNDRNELLKEDTPLREQNLLMSDNLEGITLDGINYNSRIINFHGTEIPLASETLGNALSEILDHNIANQNLHKEAINIDKKFSAYIPEEILISYTDEAIGKWCLDNGIEIIDPAEINNILQAEDRIYARENIPHITLQTFLNLMGGFPDTLSYEIVNEKIHIIDKNSHFDRDDGYAMSFTQLGSQFYDFPEDVISAFPDSVFDELYKDMMKQYSLRYPKEWESFQKKLCGGLPNCDDFYEFQKITGDDEFVFVKYVVHPELIQLDEDRIKTARKTEYFVCASIDGEKQYVKDWANNGDALFTSDRNKALKYSDLGEAVDILEPWDSPVKEYADPAELLHIEEHRLSILGWEEIFKLFSSEFNTDHKDFAHEKEKFLKNSSDEIAKMNVAAELLMQAEAENQDVFHGYNFSNKAIPPEHISNTISESISNVAREIITGNLKHGEEIRSSLKNALWEDLYFQKALVNEIITCPDEFQHENNRRELNSAAFKVLFEKEFNRNINIDSASKILSVNKGISYNQNGLYLNDKLVTFEYLINSTISCLEKNPEPSQDDKKLLKYMDGISSTLDIPSSMQREKLAERFLKDVMKSLPECDNNPLKAIKKQLQIYQSDSGLDDLNQFFNELGISTKNQDSFIKDIGRITGKEKIKTEKKIKKINEYGGHER